MTDRKFFSEQDFDNLDAEQTLTALARHALSTVAGGQEIPLEVLVEVGRLLRDRDLLIEQGGTALGNSTAALTTLRTNFEAEQREVTRLTGLVDQLVSERDGARTNLNELLARLSAKAADHHRSDPSFRGCRLHLHTEMSALGPVRDAAEALIRKMDSVPVTSVPIKPNEKPLVEGELISRHTATVQVDKEIADLRRALAL